MTSMTEYDATTDADMSETISLFCEEKATFNRSTTDEGEKGWRLKLPFAVHNRVDKVGVLVRPEDGYDYDKVKPLLKDHGIRGTKERFGWGFIRMTPSKSLSFMDATIPDTQRSRDFIEEVEHDQQYGQGGVSGGISYNPKNMIRASDEQRKLGAKLYLRSWGVAEVSYTTVPPLLPGMQAEVEKLVRSIDQMEQDAVKSAYQKSEKLLEIEARRADLWTEK